MSAVHGWNVYRYVGDYLHDAAVVALMAQLCCKRSVAGLSMRTQLLYLMVFTTRYLDLPDTVVLHLILHKVLFISTTFLALLSFLLWRDTYEHDRDTCPSWLIAAASLSVAPFVSAESDGVEIMWTFSQILEGFAMVPQYVFCYRCGDDARGPLGARTYIVAMGFYRFFYILNWLHKKSVWEQYWDPTSWASGVVNSSLFADYILFNVAGVSCLMRLTLGVDDGVRFVGEGLRDSLGACLLGPRLEEGDLEVAPRELTGLGGVQRAPPGAYVLPAMQVGVASAVSAGGGEGPLE